MASDGFGDFQTPSQLASAVVAVLAASGRRWHRVLEPTCGTGAANFDLAEAVWLKLIADLAAQQPTIALLCKTVVARNVLRFCALSGVGVGGAALHLVDARRWFGAAVSAGLFVLHLRTGAV